MKVKKKYFLIFQENTSYPYLDRGPLGTLIGSMTVQWEVTLRFVNLHLVSLAECLN